MKDKVLKVVYGAIDEVNSTQTEQGRFDKKPDTPLFGPGGLLDSIGLVNLIVDIEQEVNDVFKTAIALADERAMSQKSSPFRTIDTLVDYIVILLKERQNG